MDKQNIVLNTLVFDQQHQNGESQLSMLQRVVKFGIKNAEVRREFFNDPAQEAPEIHQFVQENGLKLFYSVPEKIFTDKGQINPELPTYFEEAKAMGVSSLKMNIGNYMAYVGDLAKAFTPYLESGIEWNVENDQTTANGSSKNLLVFLDAMKQENIDIKFVFDMGNWRFVHENEETVAKAIRPYVRYIHVKNVVTNNGHCSVVATDKGIIDWKKTLSLLPSDLPVALEYPATDAEIEAGIQLLTSYK